jgi:hypothetical protein
MLRMSMNTKAIFLTISLLAFAANVGLAQSARTIIINGGRYESAPPFVDFVTVGYWDLATNRQVLVDTIDAQSVTDAITVGDTLFVATDFSIQSYRLPSLSRLASSQPILGVRKLAKAGNKLYASRGFGTPAGQSFLLQLNASTLQLQVAVPYFAGDLENLLVDGNTLYASAPGSFASDSGNILQIDIASNSVVSALTLGSNGIGVGRLFKKDDAIYAFSTLGFGAPQGSLTQISRSGAVSTRILPYSVGYSAIKYSEGRAFGALGGDGLAVRTCSL